MRHSKYADLYDPEHGLTCHRVPVDGTTDGLVEPVRDMFIASMTNFGYVGFSREIDDIFHRRSTYVYVTGQTGEVLMTCRVTPRDPGTIVPFEMGLKEDGGSYRLDQDEHVVDINTYTYVPGHYEHSMPLLVAGLGRFARSYCATSAYCLYDIANEKIRRAYTSVGFVLSERFHEPIHFPTFCREVEGQASPVRWRIMSWDEKTIEGHDRSARERYRRVA
jgi:hypothetical protein